MGNTEVCPIAVNPTERCICTLLSTNGDFVVITRYLPRSGDKMGARNTHSMSHRLKKRRACFVSGGVDGRSDCWGFVRPTTLLGQKIITVWSTLSRWGGRTVGLLGFRPSDHFVGSKNNNSLVISVSLGVVGRSDCWDFVRPSTLLWSKKNRD